MLWKCNNIMFTMKTRILNTGMVSSVRKNDKCSGQGNIHIIIELLLK